jgi:hypothetical protein
MGSLHMRWRLWRGDVESMGKRMRDDKPKPT